MEAQVSLTVAFSSSALLGLVSLIFLLTIPHRFSMGFKGGSCLFVTYTIIQGIISSEMEVRTGPLNGQCKKIKDDT